MCTVAFHDSTFHDSPFHCVVYGIRLDATARAFSEDNSQADNLKLDSSRQIEAAFTDARRELWLSA